MDEAIHYAHYRRSQFLVIFLQKDKHYVSISCEEQETERSQTSQRNQILELTKSKGMLYHPLICRYQFLLQGVSKNSH